MHDIGTYMHDIPTYEIFDTYRIINKHKTFITKRNEYLVEYIILKPLYKQLTFL